MSGQPTFIQTARLIESRGTGYGQGATERWSAWYRKGKTLTDRILKKKEIDCSVAAVICLVESGVPIDTKTNTWTGNLAAKAKATGMVRVHKFPGLSKVKQGGLLLTPGHHVVELLDHNECLSPEGNELGKTAGGKAGDQTGREVKIRKWYNRPGGWDLYLEVIPAVEYKGRVIHHHGEGTNVSADLGKLKRIADYDGPLYASFLSTWTSIDSGLVTSFTADPVGATGRHAFVVLGSALTKDGQLAAKMLARLQLVLSAANLNPASIVIVSGGAPRNGVTEALAGARWLVENGLARERVFTETKSASTIGNAKYSVALMRKLKVTSYTLVSHASHLRRAKILFLAARLGTETAENKSIGNEQLVPLAVNDYGTKPVKIAGPVDPGDRKVMAEEVASLLGLAAYYK